VAISTSIDAAVTAKYLIVGTFPTVGCVFIVKSSLIACLVSCPRRRGQRITAR
jgi:hypothetical protein